MKLYDAHTHRPLAEALVNISPGQEPEGQLFYSAGVHPWNADLYDAQALELLLESPRVVAVGECGLDRLKGPSMERQLSVFESQIELAERLGKPLIIHCVKALEELLAVRKRRSPHMPWVFHGFRGKPEMARQLLDAGFMISFGPRFNSLSAALVPADRLLIETDDSDEDIASVAAAVARVRGADASAILDLCSGNLSAICR